MKKIWGKIVPIVAALALIIGAVGCANFLSQSHSALDFNADFYLLARQVAIDLYKDGVINEEQREEINEGAKIYRDAYYVACDALAVYYVTESAEDKVKAQEALRAAADSWAGVAKLINVIKPGLVPDDLMEVEL